MIYESEIMKHNAEIAICDERADSKDAEIRRKEFLMYLLKQQMGM